MDASVDEVWERLEVFLRQNAQQLYDGLAAGATEEEIANAEQTSGFAFPDAVRESWRRHNGHAQNERGYPLGGTFIPGYFELLSLSDIAQAWQNNVSMVEEDSHFWSPSYSVDDKVRTVFLHPAWMPFARDIGGNQICLDFDPAPSGNIGQVVEFDHEASGQRSLAPSFRAWLSGIVDDLEAGRLVWNGELKGYAYPEQQEQSDEAAPVIGG